MAVRLEAGDGVATGRVAINVTVASAGEAVDEVVDADAWTDASGDGDALSESLPRQATANTEAKVAARPSAIRRRGEDTEAEWDEALPGWRGLWQIRLPLHQSGGGRNCRPFIVQCAPIMVPGEAWPSPSFAIHGGLHRHRPTDVAGVPIHRLEL